MPDRAGLCDARGVGWHVMGVLQAAARLPGLAAEHATRGALLATLVTVSCLTAGCIDRPGVRCTNGGTCPTGMVCDETRSACVTREQAATCDGEPQLSPCSYPGVSDGACYDGVCMPAGCGNGVLDPGEACDDRNRVHGDGCAADCRSNETCGNGVVDTPIGESCDPGADGDWTGCRSTCVTELCGDGIVDPDLFEQCDDGAGNSSAPDASCRLNCQARRCGDGVMDPGAGEVCDDGNLAILDGCTPDCLSDESCGNGYADFLAGEECDDGNALDHDGCAFGCKLESPVWQNLELQPPPRDRHAMAYDPRRGRVVLFGGRGGGGGTWEWDGARWHDMTPPAGSPVPRSRTAMVYDSRRQRVVLFGGNAGAYTNDTWEWDGTSWTEVVPAGGLPRPRARHAMAYDAARGQVVLFGGVDYPADPLPMGDTWVWDGSTWTGAGGTGPRPVARSEHQMAYDPIRERVVLYGGVHEIHIFTDTWEWDGSSWQSIPSPVNPGGQRNHGMVFVPELGRIALFSGSTGEVWLWDGTTWSQWPPTGAAPAVDGGVAAYDSARAEAVLFNGPSNAETWTWTAAGWRHRRPLTGPGTSIASAYHATTGELMLLAGASGSTETWLWRDGRWRPGTTPPALADSSGFAAAYDTHADEIVLFGDDSGTGFGDTWLWDGRGWRQAQPPGDIPVARTGHAMAHAASTGMTLLFGGAEHTGKTWAWNGTRWSDVTPSSPGPQQRTGHAMAYDPVRDRVVLFGGLSYQEREFLRDTWEWHGDRWHRVAVARSPMGRHDHTLVYSPARRRVILHGGRPQQLATLSDVWEWDGQTWVDITPTGDSSPGSGRLLGFDPKRNEIVVRSGGVMWALRLQARRRFSESCAFGLDNDGDSLQACDDPDCWGYCAPLCPPGATCDPAAPRCGDSTCNSDLESCRLCPQDCGACSPVCGDALCDAGESNATCPHDCP